jgi:hypothetical protein
VTGAHDDVTGELSRIGREFAGWHPWVSGGGRWWATRKGSQPADPPEWWAMTVDADDAEGLRETISRQEQLSADPVAPCDGHRYGSGLALSRSRPTG